MEVTKSIGVRKDLGKSCTRDELDSLTLIKTKKDTAAQAARPEAIPDGTPPEKGIMFIQAALSLMAEANLLEKLWWEEMVKKYQLPDVTWIDFKTGNFYQMVNGVEEK